MNSKSATVAELPDLETALGQLHDAVSRHSRGRLETIQAALDGGMALRALRERSQHGDWGRWLHRADLTERTAHNWRRLASLGMTAEQIVAKGGMREVLIDHWAAFLATQERANDIVAALQPVASEMEQALTDEDMTTILRLYPTLKGGTARLIAENLRCEFHYVKAIDQPASKQDSGESPAVQAD